MAMSMAPACWKPETSWSHFLTSQLRYSILSLLLDGSALGGLMSRLRTQAPFLAKSWAAARPMPEEAPDMTTRLPAREGISARDKLREVMVGFEGG